MEPYGHAADWWSLGVIAFCLITGEVGAQILLHYIYRVLGVLIIN